MLALLKKDINFTKKWILISIVYAVLVSAIIMHEGATNILFTYFLVPFFVTSLPFTKIMSMEDNADTREFLKRLCIKSHKVVFARMLFIVLLLLISSVSLIAVQTMGFGLTFETNLIIKIVSVLLLFLAYFMVQLGAFYKYSYHVAQSILVVISFIAIAVGFITENLHVSIAVKSFQWSVLLLAAVIVNIIIYAVDCKLYKG